MKEGKWGGKGGKKEKKTLARNFQMSIFKWHGQVKESVKISSW